MISTPTPTGGFSPTSCDLYGDGGRLDETLLIDRLRTCGDLSGSVDRVPVRSRRVGGCGARPMRPTTRRPWPSTRSGAGDPRID